MSFPRYESYLDSGIDWLGDVPEHWSLIHLKRVGILLTEKTDRRQRAIGLENIAGWTGEYVPTESEFEGEGVAFNEGDILFGKLRPYLAKVYLAEFEGEAVGDFHVIRPDGNVNGKFLQYQMLNTGFISIVNGSTFGAKMPRASWNFMGSMTVAIPTLEEQTAIAEFLDRETAKIDDLIAEQKRLIELLKEKRQAVISHAVTKGLNPDVPMKDSGIEWLGDVPAHWEIMPVKRLAKEGRKTFTDGDWIERPYITESGIRLLQTGNVGIGEFREQGFRYISESTFEELNCTEVFLDDVLICRLDGPVGRACLAPNLGVRMITSVDNAVLKVAENVDPQYVVDVLSSLHWISWVEALCRVGGGFRLRISRSMLGELRVPVPPHDEQLEIAECIQAEKLRADSLAAEVQRAIELLQERRTALISAAVTGKIDVREYTPAEALL